MQESLEKPVIGSSNPPVLQRMVETVPVFWHWGFILYLLIMLTIFSGDDTESTCSSCMYSLFPARYEMDEKVKIRQETRISPTHIKTNVGRNSRVMMPETHPITRKLLKMT
jgi:hypothetical protein